MAGSNEWDVSQGDKGIVARTRRASDVEPRPLDPVWDGFLWAGKPTLLAGDPGLGKSMLTCDIAARVTTGAPWPTTSGTREPAEVVMLSAEDDAEDTVVPRLIAAGADLSRVTFVDGVTEYSDDGAHNAWLTIDRHADVLSDVLKERQGRVRILLIDPLSAFLGRGTDSHNEGDVRSVLAALAELAARYRVAVLAVRHLRKSEGSSAQHKIIGSVAFTAAARCVYVVARDPEDEAKRLLLSAKNNLAIDTIGYSYTIGTTAEGIPHVVWSDEREIRTADEVLGGTAEPTFAIDEAETWIRQTLAYGPVHSNKMRELSKQIGQSWRTVERAKHRMDDVLIERDVIAGRGSLGPWQWRLATPPPPTSNNGGVGYVGEKHANSGAFASPDSQAATPLRQGMADKRSGSGCPDCGGRGCDTCGDWKPAASAPPF